MAFKISEVVDSLQRQGRQPAAGDALPRLLEDIGQLMQQHVLEVENCIEEWGHHYKELLSSVGGRDRALQKPALPPRKYRSQDDASLPEVQDAVEDEVRLNTPSLQELISGSAPNGQSTMAKAWVEGEDLTPSRINSASRSGKLSPVVANEPLPMENDKAGQAMASAEISAAPAQPGKGASSKSRSAIQAVTAINKMSNMKGFGRSLAGRIAEKQEEVASPRAKFNNRSTFLSKTKQMEAKAQQTFLQRVISSKQWEWFSVGLILTNSLFIGWQTQYLASRAAEEAARNQQLSVDEPEIFLVLQIFFNLLFAVELTMRWMGEGLIVFWQSSDVWWNILDLLVVVLGLADTVLALAAGGQSNRSNPNNFSIIRVLRVVRVVRVVRIIRVLKFFRELRMMLASILGSLKSLVWVILVLFILFFVFGVSLTSACTTHMETLELRQDPANLSLLLYFGTLDVSMVSLYMAVSGGNDWVVYYEAMENLPFYHRILFILFVTFSIFAVFNIVTGVFVDTAMQSSQTDRELIVMDELDNQKTYMEAMQALFYEMDDDESGKISYEEFTSRLDDERVLAYFSSLKLDVSDPATVFQLLDWDNSDGISYQEFVAGLQRLQGESKSLDTQVMRYDVKNIRTMVEQIREDLQSRTSNARHVKGAEF